MIVDIFHALQDVETSQTFPPSPVEASLVDASAKQPGGGGLSREEKLKRKREAAVRWSLANKELKRERNRLGYQKHRDKRRVSGRLRYRRNRQRILAYQKEYYRINRQSIIEYNRKLSSRIKREQPERLRAWREKSKAKDKARAHKYRRLPQVMARHRVHSRNWNIANPLKRKRINKSWCKRNPDRVRVNQMRRRPEKRDRSVIVAFIKAIRRKPFFRCYYCKRRIARSRVCVDHVIPVAKGGLTKIGNLCASCPDCNGSKHAKLIGVWQPPTTQPVLAL